MKWISILFILFYFSSISCAFYSSTASTGTGFQSTTCTGPCCSGNGACIITTPQNCQLTDGAWQNNYFGNCTAGLCPPATVITPIAGCTVMNFTAGTVTTWWGFINIANVPIMIPPGIYDNLENLFSVPVITPPTTFPP